MVQVQNLSKSYGGQTLLENVSFQVNARERLGLVGRNGYGKTTLLRILTGVEEPDTGTVTFPRDYRVGWLDQHLRFTQPSAVEEACLGLRPEHKDDKWRAEKMLAGLGFTVDDMKKRPSEFSGGYQVRIQLAKCLAGEPDMLLLDEPTNYLDIVSIRWLIRFLNAWKGELILVTHDRAFMDSVSTHTMVIHRRKVRKIAGGTEKLYEQILQEEEVYEKTRQNDEKRRKEIETFITRFRAKARLGGLVQSRVKLLEKQTQNAALEKLPELEFQFTALPFATRRMLETENLRFRYPDGPFLIDGLIFAVEKTDRIAVIGKNGKGKSTLLRLLAGELEPVEGTVKPHPQVKTGMFGQTNIERLHPLNTVEEELCLASPDDKPRARAIAGALLFEGDLMQKKVSVLSGGEKSRVMLGKLLLSPSHLIMLDEPTNHLDMESCDSLIAALDRFDGAVIVATHNEMLLHALANRIVVLDRGKVTVFEGTYEEFLEQVGWEGEEEEKTEAKKAEEGPIVNKKDLRRARSEILARKQKETKHLEIRMKQIEAEITSRETEHRAAQDGIVEASSTGDGKRIAEFSKSFHRLTGEIEAFYTELETVTREFEAIAAKYEKELAGLE